MRSLDIIFTAAFGKEDKIIRLSSPNGGGGNCYHIMMDNYYHGMIINRLKWDVCFHNYTDEYTQAELDTLVERLNFCIGFNDL